MSRREASLPTAEDWRAAAEMGAQGAAGVSRDAARSTSRAATALQLPAALRDEIVCWCLAGRPNEACGLLLADRPSSDGGRPLRFIPMRNAAESAYRYLLDPQEQLAVMLELDDRDEVVWGIVHSHVASAAEPSQTDLGLAFYPESLYLICSLAVDPPAIRAWSIQAGRPSEVTLLPG